MDTVNKLSKYCKENGVEDVFVVGAPKTIDNDLVGTDLFPFMYVLWKPWEEMPDG